MFRFAILGAGHIAERFCDAVGRIDGCEICAVASKSLDKAMTFAKKNGIGSYYDSYETLLEKEKPDCAYIAVTQNDHYRLSMLCLKYKVPVLCEKAMFLSEADAKDFFTRSEEAGVFAMEAMWSRFLPAIDMAREWMELDLIGEPILADVAIGFRAPDDPSNRYFSEKLGGGAAYDITVYAYELLTHLFGRTVDEKVFARRGRTGVDVAETGILRFREGVQATLRCTFLASPEEKMVITGREGSIVIPHPHYASEAFLLDERGNEVRHFSDHSPNGFVYEIEEVLACITAGRLESDIVPHSDTIDCARFFDKLKKETETK